MNLFFDIRVSNPYFYEFKHLFKNKNLKKNSKCLSKCK